MRMRFLLHNSVTSKCLHALHRNAIEIKWGHTLCSERHASFRDWLYLLKQCGLYSELPGVIHFSF
jgi:hypothetical protein